MAGFTVLIPIRLGTERLGLDGLDGVLMGGLVDGDLPDQGVKTNLRGAAHPLLGSGCCFAERSSLDDFRSSG